jgi:tight adherence protein C
MDSLATALSCSAIFAAASVNLQAAASAVVGAAIGLSGWWVYQVLRSEDLQQGAEWRYDISRINELRRLSFFYRVFHPVIQRLARINRTVFPEALPEVHREIQAAALPRYWLPEEYLAQIEVLALFTIPIYSYLFVSWFGGAGLLVAFGAVMATGWFLRLRLSARAKRRLYLIKRRMPFLLDLLTLLMEAGSTFLNAMAQAVDEFHGHPVAEEFGRVLSDMNMGKTRVEAFDAMRERLADDEIGSISGAILQGEYLGTPLGQIFRTQADVLRLKRTQRAEVIAGEAGVNMLLPGILIMVATVLIIIGPFMLNYLRFGTTM